MLGCYAMRHAAPACCAVLCCAVLLPTSPTCCAVLPCAVLCCAVLLPHPRAVLPCAVLCYCLTQVHAAFSERRKLLRNNLMSLYGAKQVGRS